MAKKILWCTSHYSTEFTKKKAKELRELGYKVSFGNYIKEGNKSYCKIYLEQDLNYHVLDVLTSIDIRVNYGKESLNKAINSKNKEIKSICEKYDINLKFYSEDEKLSCLVGSDYTLYIPQKNILS